MILQFPMTEMRKRRLAKANRKYFAELTNKLDIPKHWKFPPLSESDWANYTDWKDGA